MQIVFNVDILTGIITVQFLTSPTTLFKFDQVKQNWHASCIIVLPSAAHTEMICKSVKGLEKPVSVDYIFLL